jgi:hypothetical protein
VRRPGDVGVLGPSGTATRLWGRPGRGVSAPRSQPRPPHPRPGDSAVGTAAGSSPWSQADRLSPSVRLTAGLVRIRRPPLRGFGRRVTTAEPLSPRAAASGDKAETASVGFRARQQFSTSGIDECRKVRAGAAHLRLRSLQVRRGAPAPICIAASCAMHWQRRADSGCYTRELQPITER